MFKFILALISLLVLPNFIGPVGAVVVSLVIAVLFQGERNTQSMSASDELLIGNTMMACRKGVNPASGQLLVNDIVDITGKFYGMR